MRYHVRLSSGEQRDPDLPPNVTIQQVLAEARNMGLPLPDDLSKVMVVGYSDRKFFSLEDVAVATQVLEVSQAS
jgi:hypothetical protein